MARRAGLAWRVAAALAAGAALGPAACGHKPDTNGPRPLCSIDSTIGIDKAPRDRSFPAQYWFVLLVAGYESSGEIARPAKDCSGWPIGTTKDACPTDPPLAATPVARLSPQDLVVVSLGDARRLVWAMVDRLSDGEAQGPVALAEITQKGIVVKAIGLLRAYPEHATLRLEKLGTGTVLVADGERCRSDQAEGACDRAVRVLPLVEDRFVPKPLVDDRGACVGGALLGVRASGANRPAGTGSYKLEGAVGFAPEAITVREQLTLTGVPGASGSASADFVRRVQAERQITLRGGSLVASAPSLLARWRAQHADASAAE